MMFFATAVEDSLVFQHLHAPLINAHGALIECLGIRTVRMWGPWSEVPEPLTCLGKWYPSWPRLVPSHDVIE